MRKMRETDVTFSVDGTYTVHLYIPEDTPDDDIEELARKELDKVDWGSLENQDSDILMVEQY